MATTGRLTPLRAGPEQLKLLSARTDGRNAQTGSSKIIGCDGSSEKLGDTMLKKVCFVTTALVLCAPASLAENETIAPTNANAQFSSWYGGSPAAGARYHFMPRDGSTLLYAQSASSGFSSYAVSATNFTSSGFCCFGNIAADDFIIPGTGTHQITEIYAAGTFSGQLYGQSWMITFYDKLKYDRKTGITTAVIKAGCESSSYSAVGGDVLVDVSSCNLGRFRGGHDYAVAVQWNSGECCNYNKWSWQTNRNQIKRQAFYFTYGRSGSCPQQFTPIKTCFPGTGYGPDLAFAIYGS